jgi:hypothetical protein
VHMDTTDTIRTLALPMATTVLTGLSAVFSSGLARGSTVLGGWDAGVGRMDGTVVRGTVIRDGVALGMVIEDGVIVAATRTDSLEGHSTVRRRSMVVGFTAEASMVEADFMAAEVSTVEADFMEVAAMVADTGKNLAEV